MDSTILQPQWQPIASAPFDRDLELAVLDAGETHALVFPCRRVLKGWMKAKTSEAIPVRPTHWREWREAIRSCWGRHNLT